jgi:benzil reductase ((S)-benzoin forming)
MGFKKIAIITGGSKGIGAALVRTYVKHGFSVFSLSRTAAHPHPAVTSLLVDLSDPTDALNVLNPLLERISRLELSEIVFINNAGSLGDIAPIEKNTPESIQKTIALNTTTPICLSSSFVKKLKDCKTSKRILNISSGAAKKPYEGWTVYCSSKAGLDMATRTMALEQNSEKEPVKINGIYPGIVETGMQHQIRNKSEKEFKNVKRFIELKNNDGLLTPTEVAKKIFHLDTDAILENGAIVDIRQL